LLLLILFRLKYSDLLCKFFDFHFKIITRQLDQKLPFLDFLSGNDVNSGNNRGFFCSNGVALGIGNAYRRVACTTKEAQADEKHGAKQGTHQQIKSIYFHGVVVSSFDVRRSPPIPGRDLRSLISISLLIPFFMAMSY